MYPLCDREKISNLEKMVSPKKVSHFSENCVEAFHAKFYLCIYS